MSAAADLRGRRVFVTGASGFIGARLTRRLLELGCEVVAHLRPGSDPWRIAPLLDRVEVVHADLAEPGVACPDGVGVVFHLAAAGVHPGAQEDAADLVRANVEGTVRLVQAAQRAGAERFVHCGSCFEYGAGADLAEDAALRPATAYGASKAAAGLLAQAAGTAAGLPVVTLRPFTVYGPGEAPRRLVPHVIRGALRGARIELTGGTQARDFVFVDDAVEAFVLAAAVPAAAGGTFNVATGAPVTVRDVVHAVFDVTGGDAVPVFGDLAYRPTDATVLSGSPARAREVLGWRATTPLRAGLEQTVAWVRGAAVTAAGP